MGRMAKIEDRELVEHKLNESDVAMEFAYQVKSGTDYDIYTEVKLPSEFHRSGQMRVDAILTKRGTNEVVRAVEFKRPGKRVGPRSRQQSAYRGLGVPVSYCVGFEDIPRILGGITSDPTECK
jgi:hypothetical protein